MTELASGRDLQLEVSLCLIYTGGRMLEWRLSKKFKTQDRMPSQPTWNAINLKVKQFAYTDNPLSIVVHV